MSEYPICQFPTCTRHPEKNGYCIGHQLYADTPLPKKEKASLPKRSDKMKDQMKEYKKKAKAFLSQPENIMCKVEMPGCTKVAEGIHHVAGRTGNSLTDESNWLPSCGHCNLAVEANDGLAREKGVKKSRITEVVK